MRGRQQALTGPRLNASPGGQDCLIQIRQIREKCLGVVMFDT